MYINGGGSLIQDVTSRRSLWFYLYTLWRAKKMKVPVMMYGCGIGPVKRAYNRRLSGRIIDKYVDCITLREDESLEELREMGVTKPEIVLAADPSLTLPAAPEAAVTSAMLTEGLDPAGNYVCFALRQWPGFSERRADIAAAANFAYERYGFTPVFFSINPVKDASAAREVAELLRCPCVILQKPMEPGLAIGFMARMKAVVSMRLHGLIFAASHGVPLVGIVYDPKVSAFLHYLGQEQAVELQDADGETLARLLAAAVDGFRPEEREQAVERLREKEKANRESLAKLLGIQ